MPEVQRSVHIRVWKVPKPLGILLVDLCTSETCGFFLRWGIGFENVLPFPVILVLLFQGLQIVPLAGLPIERIISDRADDAKGGETPAQVRGCLTYMRRQRTALMVQIFYNSSESVTRDAKARVSCQLMMWVADTDQSSFALSK